MMKYWIYCFLLFVSLMACGQQQTNRVHGIDIKDEVKRLKNFDNEPIYQLRVKTGYAFTILINGIPIANKYAPYPSHYFGEINSCIPAKGAQQIEIQIYPRFADVETQKETLENEIDFELEIQKTAWKEGSLEEPETIYRYQLPAGDYSTQKAFIHSDVFAADIPYQLIDWRKGRTFNKEDTAILKEKALQVYEELIAYYETQRGDDFVNAIGKGIFNLCQSSYLDAEEALDHINHTIAFIQKKERNLADMENFQLEILGGGKLLSLKRIDGFNRGEGVIRRYYRKGRQEKVHVYDILLYAPRSPSAGNELEVIWHMNLVKGANP